jgi:maleylpyruvate isomerase
MSPVNQPSAPYSVELMIGRITEAGERLAATASGLTDEQVREPSLLPGWSRGHVLTHIARNADGLRNLLIWAETGVETPQYNSGEERDAQIEDGAARPASELATDVSDSAQAFLAKARELSEEAWTAEVRGFRGPAHPGWFTLQLRLAEVEIHHVDLAAGYGPSDWPDWFVTDLLYRVTGQLWANQDTPKVTVTDAETGRQFFLRQDGTSELEVTGPGATLLAWLLGRDDGASLAADQEGPLPSIPPY